MGSSPSGRQKKGCLVNPDRAEKTSARMTVTARQGESEGFERGWPGEGRKEGNAEERTRKG